MGRTVDTDNSKPTKPSKKKQDDVLTKVIIRRLPPSFQKENFLSKLDELFPHGLPEYDYFRFCGSDLSFSPISFSRAYINFKNSKDILKFKENLDGYVFSDGKGGNYPVVVEFAPFQGIPKRNKRKKDIKCATIEKDSDYLSFLENLNQEVEPLPSAEVYLEQQEANKQSLKEAKMTTPLIEYIKMKRTSVKSRTLSQPRSLSSNDKKRKPPKESGKPSHKSSYMEKSSRPSSASEGSKKGSERKVDDYRSAKKFGKDDVEKKRQGSSAHGNEKRPAKSSHDWKEKQGEKEEKERTVRKERPASAKSWKENKSNEDYHRSGSSAGRPPSSYRTTRRDKAAKEPARMSENTGGNTGKNRSESGQSVKGARSSEKEERTPNKYQDNKERVRNKDRPTQAIYTPRSRSRGDQDDSTAKNSGRQVNKEQKERNAGKVFRDNAPRDSGPRDSGPRDSGPRDSGPRDSGPRDSGPRDSGPRDSGRRQGGRENYKVRNKPAEDDTAAKE